MKRYIAIIVVMTFIFSCKRENRIPNEISNIDYEEYLGKELYQRWCSSCHGIDGKGEGLGWGGDVKGKPKDLTIIEKKKITESLNKKNNTGCPIWADNFTNSEKNAIVIYINRTLKGKTKNDKK